MKLLNLVISTLIIINTVPLIKGSISKLSILSSTNFPHKIENYFVINFEISNVGNNYVYLVVKDGMKLDEKILINLKNDWKWMGKSKYFDEIVLQNGSSLEIKFNKASHFRVLEIYEKSTKSHLINLSKSLYRDFIDLIIQPKLNNSTNNLNLTLQYSLVSFVVKELKHEKEINRKQNDLILQIVKTLEAVTKKQKDKLETDEKKFVKVIKSINSIISILPQKMKINIIKKHFIQIKWKVSKAMIKPNTDNIIDCAYLANNNEIFGFQYKNSKCILYPTFDYCDNNLKYEVETIYARKSEWNKISSSAAYQILRNITNVMIKPYLYLYSHVKLDEKKKTQSILKVGDKTILAVSTERGIRAAAFGVYYLSRKTNLMNNLAKWLARGRCVDYRSCTFRLRDKNRFLNSSGGILELYYANVNKIDADIYNKIESGDCGVMFFGKFNNAKYNKMITKYGFTMDSTSYREQELKISDYIC